jgi:hypothetical protein
MTCEHPKDIPAGVSIINRCGCAVIRVEATQVVYSFEALIHHFKEHEGMISSDDLDDTTEAQEWVEFNVLRGLAYIRNPPAISFEDYGESLSDDDVK